MPAAAKGSSEAAAKAFVRYWVATLNYAGANGDTRLLRKLSDPDCVSCTGIIDKIDRVHSRGGYFEGRGWSVLAISAVSGQPARKPIFEVGMLLAEQRVLEAAGEEVQHFDGGKQPMVFRLARSNSWRVTRIDEVQ